MISKKFNNWKDAIKSVKAVSHSIGHSIGSYEPATPKALKRLEAENQFYYHSSWDDFDEFEEWWLWKHDDDAYHTGGGTGFSWEIHDDGTVTITLHHASGWHPTSSLLAAAWEAGFRGELPFPYDDADLNRIKRAKLQQDAIITCLDKRVSIEEIIKAKKNGVMVEFFLDLVIEAAKKDAERKAAQEAIVRYEELDEYDEQRLPESTLTKLLKKQNLFDDD